MKAFISVDLEGMPHIVAPAHYNLKGSLFEEARRIATRLTLVMVEELNKNGFDEVVVADSHGPMVNLLVDDLPEYVEIVRGPLRPASMVSGVEGCEAAMFVGYHAKYGTAKSAWDHTYSGSTIRRVEINGVEAGEFLLNAYAAGYFEVPVILVAGDAKLLESDVAQHAPWAETVVFKSSLSRVAAKSASMLKIEKELRDGVKRAAANFRQNRVAPLVAKKPIKMGLTFNATHHADVAELLSTVTRVDGLKIEFTSNDILEAYNTFQLLIFAAFGTAYLLEHMR